ncbi:MAG: phosphinothricin acetyltransferase [Chloroflexi bacterium]|jgi:phosphinothricin acetyltransferase|nr:MAG: phosphinothricin acetyltransferase [Chloroflexota bacterium]
MAVIRLADPKREARQVAAIYYPYVINTPITFETNPPDGTEMYGRMKKVSETYTWLVCEHENEIMGYSYGSKFRDRSAYDWIVETTVYVREAAHGLGIGKALYASLLECLKLQGFTSAYGVIALPNDPSISLHEHFGFTKDYLMTNAGYKDGEWYDVGFWRLNLNHPTEIMEPINLIDSVRKTSTFTEMVTYGEQFLKLS